MASSKNPLYTNGMPGRNWDVLNTPLDSLVIPEMERDAIAMLKYLAQHPEKASDSWLFPYGMIALLGDTRESCEEMHEKMRLSSSWILNVTRLFTTAVQVRMLQITMEALGGSRQPETPLRDFFQKANIRPARNSQEDELLDAIIALAPQILQLSTEGLGKYHSYMQTSSSNSSKPHRSITMIILGLLGIFMGVCVLIYSAQPDVQYSTESIICSTLVPLIPGLLLFICGMLKIYRD